MIRVSDQPSIKSYKIWIWKYLQYYLFTHVYILSKIHHSIREVGYWHDQRSCKWPIQMSMYRGTRSFGRHARVLFSEGHPQTIPLGLSAATWWPCQPDGYTALLGQVEESPPPVAMVTVVQAFLCHTSQTDARYCHKTKVTITGCSRVERVPSSSDIDFQLFVLRLSAQQLAHAESNFQTVSNVWDQFLSTCLNTESLFQHGSCCIWKVILCEHTDGGCRYVIYCLGGSCCKWTGKKQIRNYTCGRDIQNHPCTFC